MTATVGEGVALLRAGVDALLGAGLSPLSSVDVTQAFAALETERRRLEAVDHRFIAELTDRGAAGEYGRTSTTDLVATLLRINPGEAKARVERTIDVGPRRTLSGERLAPTFPAVADAVHAGAISAAHVRVITACLDEIPSPIVPTAAPIAEHLLVQTATHCDPATTARTGRELLARLNPDGIEPTDDDIARRRDLTLHHRSNGSARLTGELTAEALAVWTPIIDALSAPVPADPAGEPDDRSAGQRRHDGFVEAGRRLLRSRSLPASGGAPVTVLVTMRAEQFTAGGDGYARIAHGGLISVAELLRMAAEVELTTVVLNPAGGVLSYGRLARLASCDQRRALAARDGGCCFPGCTRPPAWTEAHHVVPWQDGGPDRPRQPVPALRFPSPRVRASRVAGAHARRRARMVAAALARPAPAPPAKYLGPPRRLRLRRVRVMDRRHTSPDGARPTPTDGRFGCALRRTGRPSRVPRSLPAATLRRRAESSRNL